MVEVLEKFDARCAVSARWARGWVEALGKKKKLAPETSEVFPKQVSLSQINSRFNSLAKIRYSVTPITYPLVENIIILNSSPQSSFVPHVLRLFCWSQRHWLEIRIGIPFWNFNHLDLHKITTAPCSECNSIIFATEHNLSEPQSYHGIHESHLLEARPPGSS